jgi:hypothetical protein
MMSPPPLDEKPLLDPDWPPPLLDVPPSPSSNTALLFPHAMNTGTHSEHPTIHLEKARIPTSKPSMLVPSTIHRRPTSTVACERRRTPLRTRSASRDHDLETPW